MNRYIKFFRVFCCILICFSVIMLSSCNTNNLNIPNNENSSSLQNKKETINQNVKYNINPTESPLYYAKLSCDTFMKTYGYWALPPVGVLFYHQGVLLSGMQRVYLQTGDEKYFNYIKKYIDSVIGPEGEIYGIEHELTHPSTPDIAKRSLTMLDSKQPVILFYNLYDETKDEKYLNSIKSISESMYYWPVNSVGGYWHMMTQHNQMWLDSAYMAGPLSVMYAQRFDAPKLRDRAIEQIFIMDDNMKDKQTGLYYHGWDPTRAQPWADKKTGLSGQVWGRALGWYSVAILDMLDYIPDDHPDVPRLKQISADLLRNLAKYQDKETGMWYQVIDKPDNSDNWLESSCTNLFIYSYAKAIRKGIISKDEFGPLVEKAYKGSLASTYIDENGDFVIDNVCIGTMIDSGSYEHYITRDKVKNDLHGGGAFILMCTEMENYYNLKDE